MYLSWNNNAEANSAAVLVEGWRFLPHSYALVNHFQCLEMMRRPAIELFHRDLPLAHPDWRQMRGMFDSGSEEQIANLSQPPPGGQFAATFRIGFPYDMSRSPAAQTAVFGTVQSALRSNYFVGGQSIKQAMQQSGAVIITPSNWSRDRFIESGASADRVQTVPHGIEPAIFHPASPQRRREIRQKANCENNFVFLHIGAMTGNKNIGLLLRAFAVVAQRYPHTRLALKGLDPLYGSANLLKSAAAELTQAQMAIVRPRLGYWGGAWPMAKMTELYQSADAYVSPYSAEGFNLPALEAAACGLPLICTAGGPTDEFTTPSFCLRIDSTIEPTQDVQPGRLLVPSFDSLVAHMFKVIEEPAFAARAAVAAPAHVAEHFTWASVVDRLLEVLLPEKSRLTAASGR